MFSSFICLSLIHQKLSSNYVDPPENSFKQIICKFFYCNSNAKGNMEFFLVFGGGSRICIFNLAIASNCLQLRFIWFVICTSASVSQNDGVVNDENWAYK